MTPLDVLALCIPQGAVNCEDCGHVWPTGCHLTEGLAHLDACPGNTEPKEHDMDEENMARLIVELLTNFQHDDIELGYVDGSRIEIEDVRSFDDEGLLTKNAGVVVRVSGGHEFQLTVVQSKIGDERPSSELIEPGARRVCMHCGEKLTYGRDFAGQRGWVDDSDSMNCGEEHVTTHEPEAHDA